MDSDIADPGAGAIDRHVGQRIAFLRAARGLTSRGLADRLGVTEGQVEKYEAGVNRVAASRLFAVGAVLGAPVSTFYKGLASGGEGSGEDRTDGLRQIIAAWAAIRPARRRLLIDLALKLATEPGDLDLNAQA